jgi:hypothetical protein
MRSVISSRSSCDEQEAITLERFSLYAAKLVEFSESVLTKSKKGTLEVRSLDHRGNYVICKYLDPRTMKLADTKRKLLLKDELGKVTEYFIIPLKDPKRALLISPEAEEKDRQLWNEKLEKTEEIWQE